MPRCVVCGRETVPLEQALTKKIINRSAEKFLCKTCLAAKFGCSESRLDDMAEKFRKQGCMLFR